MTISAVLRRLCWLVILGRVVAAGVPAAWQPVGQAGGPTQAVAVRGNYAYVGVGVRLVVLDISNPASLRQVGATRPFPYFVQAVAVSGSFAYVAAGGSGLRVVDVSDPARPLEVGSLGSRGFSEGVAVAASTVYLADGPAGLRMVSVANPASPLDRGTAFGMNYAFGVAVAGRYAYVAAAGAGLLIADVTDPSQPLEVGSLSTPGYAYGVALAADIVSSRKPLLRKERATPQNVPRSRLPYVYVADGWGGVQTVNVSDPRRPVPIASFATPGWAFGVTVSGEMLYVADSYVGLRVLDAADPASLTEIGSYVVAGGNAGTVAVAGSTAYIADRNWGLHAVSVSNPSQPAQVGFFAPMGYGDAVTTVGNLAYVAAGDFGFRVVDISDPANPQEIGFFDTAGYATSIVVNGHYAYTCTQSAGSNFQVVDVSDPASPTLAGKMPLQHGVCRSMTVVGATAYVAEESGLELIDLTNPNAPAPLGALVLQSPSGDPSTAVGVTVRGTLAYLAASFAGLIIVDVSDPHNLVQMGSWGATGNDFTFSQDVAVSGNLAYLADYHGLRIVDVSDPAKPVGVSFFPLPGDVYGLALVNNTIWVTDGSRGLAVIDASNPSSPQLLWSVQTPGYVSYVAVADGFAYLADGPDGLLVLERPATGQTAETTMRRMEQKSGGPRLTRAGFRHSVATVPAPRPALAVPSRSRSPLPAANLGACVVNSVADSGTGTLRWCLLNVASGATITFDASVFSPRNPATIQLAAALDPISQGGITIDASNSGVILNGTQVTGSSDGLSIQSANNTIMGLQIMGFPGNGIGVYASGNTIGGDRTLGQGPTGRGNVIGGNAGNGINVHDMGVEGNIIIGNLVGTDASGSRAVGNGGNGVFIGQASANRVGGVDARDRNIVSGNLSNGISIVDYGNGNQIIGNYSGTDITGTVALSNQGYGIGMELSSFGNVVQGNLASGNLKYGILISDPGSNYNTIVGNWVGTDAPGTKAIPNQSQGIFVGFMGSSFNRIGGAQPQDRNVVSGNPYGIGIAGVGAVGNIVMGNWVGLDASGAQALTNVQGGVSVSGGARAIVGGATPAERNIIAGNGHYGVQLVSDFNAVLGNWFGTDSTGTGAVGNSWAGIDVQGASNILQANVVTGTSGSPGDGILVDTYTGNRLRQNSIYGNSRLAIELTNGGNASLAAPVLTLVDAESAAGFACPGCTVEIFSDAADEGRYPEGSTDANASGAFVFRKGTAFTGSHVRATCTDALGDTSELSSTASAASNP